MNNSKTSYSLNKLNPKKISHIITSQRSIKNSQLKRRNYSQLSNHKDKYNNNNNNNNNNEPKYQQNQTVYEQYYGKPSQNYQYNNINMNNNDNQNQHQNYSNNFQIDSFNNTNSLIKLKNNYNDNYNNRFSQQQKIQQKIRRALQDPYNIEQDYNNDDFNIVFEQSDIDDDFLQKITQNKQLIKIQKENNKNHKNNNHKNENSSININIINNNLNNNTNVNIHTLSQQMLKNNHNQKKYAKKISLINPNSNNNIKQLTKQQKKQKTLKKNKSKSLFPPIKNLSLKTINLHLISNNYQNYNKIDQKLAKNQSLQKINSKQIKIQKTKNLPNERKSLHQKNIKQENYYNEQKNNTPQQNENKISRKSIKRKYIDNTVFTQQKIKSKINKQGQLKQFNRLSDLKNRIGQRKSGKNLKSRLSIINQDESRNVSSNLNRITNSPRYSFNSLFDSIQQFLSNPHQNNLKSQLKYFKFHQKLSKISSKDKQYKQKQQQKLRQKIRLIQQKIKSINQEQNKHKQIYTQRKQISSQQYNDQKDSHQNNIMTIRQSNIQNKSHIGIIQQNKNTLQISPSVLQVNTNSEYGTLQWRRLQKDKIKKSDFQKELKYVLSLEQKNQIILGTYIQNKKMLHQLNLLKKNKVN